MSVALRHEPPVVDGVRFVDGGIALRHTHWLEGCQELTAFSWAELWPIPDEVTCAHCGRTTPLKNPDVLDKLEELASVATTTTEAKED